MQGINTKRHARLMCGAAFAAAAVFAGQAQAETGGISIPAQPLTSALNEFGMQSQHPVLSTPDLTAQKISRRVANVADPDAALRQLLEGTGLTFTRSGDTFLIVQAETIRSSVARPAEPIAPAETVSGSAVEGVVVTAQKRSERIQDVPIAISAFSADALQAQKIEGGFDLLKAIPNVTFTKTNFTSYNFSIRGVGTQAISATTDPGVAVAFNNSGIIQNRLFEQEYLDVERVEVLRGPQGTLYGRNATAGVINVISATPKIGEWSGDLKMEVGNYDTSRLRGVINIPLGDTLAIRGAVAGTRRAGYTYNSTTDSDIDGRELWTGRLSVGWEPAPQFRADLIWEHFEEDDDRLRTGKQLCHRDDGPTEVGGVPVTGGQFGFTDEEAEALRRAYFSQGCQPGSLYDDGAFGTPNGLSYNFVAGLLAVKGLLPFVSSEIGYDPDLGADQSIIRFGDPYGGKEQSRNLREISSILNPRYRAEADIVELNVTYDLSDSLTFSSQTAYVNDETYSFQDFNRFNTEPVFTDTSNLWLSSGNSNPSVYEEAAPGGVFCDPQIGCSDTIAGFDIAQASAEQFSQEFRLQSEYAGPFNFSLGANYTKFDTLIDYYVMFNLLTAMAETGPFNVPAGSWYAAPAFSPPPGPDDAPFDPTVCAWGDFFRGVAIPSAPVPTDDPRSACPHVDPNPIDHSKNFEGDGHNYFRSKNPYHLDSWAIFGETYWNIQDNLKLTLGLRYTDDRKTSTNVPSQLLLAPSYLAGGVVASGYPEDGTIEQKWGEWTGRVVLDWRPELDFTDDTLIYGSFSRGYKGGGANPPRPGFATTEQLYDIAAEQGLEDYFAMLDPIPGFFPVLEISAAEYENTFDPEFVNAYEIGTKNTLFSGGLTFNATAFYYDYTGYQVSQIRDRTAVNENFDATMWGLELEALFTPSENWQFLANVGYLNTRIADGERSIDIMNRTQGNPDYTLVKPWAQLPSNCVVPTAVAAENVPKSIYSYVGFCGIGGLLSVFTGAITDPNYGNTQYDPANYPDLNGGAGLYADLGGNELPNSPKLTAMLGGQYSFDVASDWRATVRADFYWQDESWHRVYNFEPYDRLESWTNTNLSFWVENVERGVTVEAYVKNLFDETPITGAFLNSDDTGLTTNVFMLDPRVIGVSITTDF